MTLARAGMGGGVGWPRAPLLVPLLVPLLALLLLAAPEGPLRAAPLGDAATARELLRLPFGQQLDLRALTAVAQSTPPQLVHTIEQFDVEVLRVPAASTVQPVEPLLAALPRASAALLEQAEFRDSYDGRVVPRGSACCPRAAQHTLILIRESAPLYTLIHEFIQSQLEPVDRAAALDDGLELRFTTAMRRLTLYQRRLLDDPFQLLDPRWRRDLLAAQADVVALLHDRLRMGQSQEVIVETLLRRHLGPGSPYFDAARRDEGRRYAMDMFNNAVEVFNCVHSSVAYGAEAVHDLRSLVRDGLVDEVGPLRLQDDDVTAYDREARTLQAGLDRVRDELGALRRFHDDAGATAPAWRRLESAASMTCRG